jgi:hypothetical protein
MKDRRHDLYSLKKYNNEKLFRMCRKIVGEDKKFCRRLSQAYNNKINKDNINFMRNINNKLRKIIVYC